MVIRKAFLFFSLLVCPIVVQAQKVKLAASSSKSWSGGIAGRYGTNYSFTVEFSDYVKGEPKPDTLWIGNKCIPLLVKVESSPAAFNTVRTKNNGKLTFVISCVTDNRDDKQRTTPDNTIQRRVPTPVPPKKYKGVALLSYKYQGRHQYFVIDKIITVSPPVNYP